MILAHFEGKLKHYQRPVSTGLNQFGSHRSLAVFTRSSLLRSFNFAVLSGPGPVQSRSLAGPRTGPSNTTWVVGSDGFSLFFLRIPVWLVPVVLPILESRHGIRPSC